MSLIVWDLPRGFTRDMLLVRLSSCTITIRELSPGNSFSEPLTLQSLCERFGPVEAIDWHVSSASVHYKDVKHAQEAIKVLKTYQYGKHQFVFAFCTSVIFPNTSFMTHASIPW
jgi:hypothetical protein